MAGFLETLGVITGLLVFVALVRAAWELGPGLAYAITGRWLVKRGAPMHRTGENKAGRRFEWIETVDGRILWAAPAKEEED